MNETEENSTSNNLTKTYQYLYDQTSAEVSAVLSWILSVFIIILNIIVLIVICNDKKKKSRMYFFLLHLAIADLFVGLFDVMPSAIERTVGLVYGTTDIFILPTAVCKTERAVAKVTLVGSNYLLAAMSIDRALVVGKPMLRFGKGPTIQRATIVICWVAAMFVAIPDAVLHQVYPNKHGGPKCLIHFESDVFFKWTVRFWTDVLFIFLIPAVIMVTSYTFLLINIYKRGTTSTTSSNGDLNFQEGSNTRVFNRRLSSSKMRSIKLTLGIVLCFIICWAPFFVWNGLQLYQVISGRNATITVAMTLRYLNSAANPIMFFVFHWKSRHENNKTVK